MIGNGASLHPSITAVYDCDNIGTFALTTYEETGDVVAILHANSFDYLGVAEEIRLTEDGYFDKEGRFRYYRNHGFCKVEDGKVYEENTHRFKFRIIQSNE